MSKLQRLRPLPLYIKRRHQHVQTAISVLMSVIIIAVMVISSIAFFVLVQSAGVYETQSHHHGLYTLTIALSSTPMLQQAFMILSIALIQ